MNCVGCQMKNLSRRIFDSRIQRTDGKPKLCHYKEALRLKVEQDPKLLVNKKRRTITPVT